jgi:hypothetical protein
MLSILFLTRNGSSLVFLAGLFVLPVLISFFSILFKLIKFNKKKYYLVRPILTIAIFFLIIAIAQWTYKVALDEIIYETKIIHDECNLYSICPKNPNGWDVDKNTIRRNNFGIWIYYTAIYGYDESNLKIRVYRGPDIGEVITGGVGLPFEVKPYIENENQEPK